MDKVANEIETLYPIWTDLTIPVRSFCHLLLVRGDDSDGISFSTVRKIMEAAEKWGNWIFQKNYILFLILIIRRIRLINSTLLIL